MKKQENEKEGLTNNNYSNGCRKIKKGWYGIHAGKTATHSTFKF